eukprot:4159837-Amphidinium_carterae.1
MKTAHLLVWVGLCALFSELIFSENSRSRAGAPCTIHNNLKQVGHKRGTAIHGPHPILIGKCSVVVSSVPVAVIKACQARRMQSFLEHSRTEWLHPDTHDEEAQLLVLVTEQHESDFKCENNTISQSLSSLRGSLLVTHHVVFEFSSFGR